MPYNKWEGKKYKKGDIVKHAKWTPELDPKFVYRVENVVCDCSNGDVDSYVYTALYENDKKDFVRECKEAESKWSQYPVEREVPLTIEEVKEWAPKWNDGSLACSVCTFKEWVENKYYTDCDFSGIWIHKNETKTSYHIFEYDDSRDVDGLDYSSKNILEKYPDIAYVIFFGK